MMASHHVEANSLSDITQLAANPPKYPRNPTETKRQPLTLYIARVPGTRDIILTTLKPQLKNVTASDVANSLYYLHLNTDEDFKLLEEEQHLKSDNESILSTHKPMPRKPLPGSARSSLDLNRQSAPPLLKLDSNTKLPSRRKPVGGDAVTQHLEPTQSKPPLSRRPLGPRPQASEAPVNRKPLVGSEHHFPNEAHSLQSRSASPSRPSADAAAEYVERHSHPQSGEKMRPPAFTITIIRRDPSSASQWNIGTVTGTPTSDEGAERSTANMQQSKRPYFNMSVNLATPGYGPFRNSYVASTIEKKGANPPHYPPGSEHANQALPSYGFERDVRMEGSDFWARSSFQHKRTRSDMSVKQGFTRGRSFSGSEGVDAVAPVTSSQAKGYMFLSPWGGRCKFSTSSSGRSLRCRHTLPEPVSANDAADSLPPAQASVAVSEIRFNLPSAAIFNSVAETFSKKGDGEHPRFSIPSFDHIRSKLSSHKSHPALPPRPHPDSLNAQFEDDGPPHPPRTYRTSFQTSSEDETPRNTRWSQNPPPTETLKRDDDEHHFDLSLGQEKAGGGNRGKRAKLGKLIIHDEGFKFLDLLVSANMAVWWSVWEPEF